MRADRCRHFISTRRRWSADCSKDIVITRLPFHFHASVALTALFAAALSQPLAAQTASTAAKPSDDITMLGRFEVSGVPIEQQILPTSRPFNSVFGTDLKLIEAQFLRYVAELK